MSEGHREKLSRFLAGGEEAQRAIILRQAQAAQETTQPVLSSMDELPHDALIRRIRFVGNEIVIDPIEPETSISSIASAGAKPAGLKGN